VSERAAFPEILLFAVDKFRRCNVPDSDPEH
jgi:hypothetical protein